MEDLELEDEIIEDELDEDVDDIDEDELDDEDLDEEDSDDKQEDDKDSDEYDDIFGEDEEFSTEGLDLDKIEGYNDDEDTKAIVDSIAKELHSRGVGKKQIKPVVEYMAEAISKMEDEYASPITKEKFQSLSPEVRTEFRKLDSELKTRLTKEERQTFMKLFNDEGKINLALKLLGKGGNSTGKTNYSEGGRKVANQMNYDDFDRRVQNITTKYLGNDVLEKKALSKLYKEASASGNKDILEYIKDNPLV